jgi:hypothetical protein
MTRNWYYAEGEKSVGPLSLADLIAILSRVSKAESVLIWRDGLSNWVEAKNLPELAPHVIKPPLLPVSSHSSTHLPSPTRMLVADADVSAPAAFPDSPLSGGGAACGRAAGEKREHGK